MTNELSELLQHAQAYRIDNAPAPELIEATEIFLARVMEHPEELEDFLPLLSGQPAHAAAWLALTLGALAERGASAASSFPSLLELLQSWLAQLPEAPEDPEDSEEEEEIPDLDEHQEAIVEALPTLCQSIVAHLARLPEERHRLGQQLELHERLEFASLFSHGPVWVSAALTRQSASLIALEMQSGQGFRFEVENVGNCFHLFSLLQDTLKRSETAPARKLLGALGHKTERLTHAWWHYGQASPGEPSLDTSIWGEGSLAQIPETDGCKVILLWPPILASRGWNEGFFGPELEALPSQVRLAAPLTEAESQAWFARLELPWPMGA